MTTTTNTLPTTTNNTTATVTKASKRHNVSGQSILRGEFGALALHLANVNMHLANTASQALTIKPVSLTMLGRNGEQTLTPHQPVSGIIDNWLVTTISKKAINTFALESLFDTIIKAENNTGKLQACPKVTKENKQAKTVRKIHAYYTAVKTLQHTINCFQAMRLESTHNSVKKLLAIGYNRETTTTILIGLNQIAYTLRPDFMSVKNRLCKARKNLYSTLSKDNMLLCTDIMK